MNIKIGVIFLGLFLVPAIFSETTDCNDRFCTLQYEPICVYDTLGRCFKNAGNGCQLGILNCQDPNSKLTLKLISEI